MKIQTIAFAAAIALSTTASAEFFDGMQNGTGNGQGYGNASAWSTGNGKTEGNGAGNTLANANVANDTNGAGTFPMNNNAPVMMPAPAAQ